MFFDRILAKKSQKGVKYGGAKISKRCSKMMGTIRNIIINAALGVLVVAFILFWVFAGIGMQEISLCTAFLVYVLGKTIGKGC